MDVMSAAVVLSWIALVVLGFGLAGVLYQVRGLQAAVLAQRDQPPPGRPAVPSFLLPQDGRQLSLVLLVDENCPICHDVFPVFDVLARERTDIADFSALARAATTLAPESNAVSPADATVPRPASDNTSAIDKVVVHTDAAAFAQLDPGWLPALVGIDSAGRRVLAEPAGSRSAIQGLMTRVDDLATTQSPQRTS